MHESPLLAEHGGFWKCSASLRFPENRSPTGGELREVFFSETSVLLVLAGMGLISAAVTTREARMPARNLWFLWTAVKR